MKLFIVPGGGDPESELYKQGFDLIKEEATKRGFESVFVFKFPGHFSLTGDKEFLNQKVAKEIVLKEILKAEEAKTDYNLFGRSYGCGVIMELLLNHKFNHLKRVVLWGPSPILNIYRVTVFDKVAIEIAKKEKGCFVNEESYTSCNPFEIQLLEYHGKQKVIICAGKLDKHCKPVFFDFLKSYLGEKENITIETPIEKLEHEVTGHNEQYINLIFGN